MASLILIVIILFLAPVIHIRLVNRRVKDKLGLSIGAITGMCLGLGFLMPVLIFLAGTWNLPAGMKCITGPVSVIIVGWFISLVIIAYQL
jgi:protein-S-isoprenylcysteine O-methyltransferase Ste14